MNSAAALALALIIALVGVAVLAVGIVRLRKHAPMQDRTGRALVWTSMTIAVADLAFLLFTL